MTVFVNIFEYEESTGKIFDSGVWELPVIPSINDLIHIPGSPFPYHMVQSRVIYFTEDNNRPTNAFRKPAEARITIHGISQ